MRGETHVFYSLLSAAILFPFFSASGNPVFLLLAAAGIFIGSLAPDADCADSAIMHGLLGGSGRIRTIRRHTILILPFFGYIIRYFVYYPVSFLVFLATLGKVKPKHRGLLHSFFGIAVASVLLLAYLTIIISLLIRPLSAESLGVLLNSAIILCAGVFAGSFMHLLEDSCTHSGVFWLFPFKNTKISGTLTPGGRRNWIILLTLGSAALISLYLSENNQGSQPLQSIMPALLFLSAWTIVFFISGVHKKSS
ncbi:MAG: metal-dependent hydrolase [Methanomicrobiaceae archaeon]|nr:metal-dependent hydrolase [Methanomicrobiaceae archaeon]